MVVNGTKDASVVHKKWLGNHDERRGASHLSTRMTGGHRKEIIQETKRPRAVGLDTSPGVDIVDDLARHARQTPERPT